MFFKCLNLCLLQVNPTRCYHDERLSCVNCLCPNVKKHDLVQAPYYVLLAQQLWRPAMDDWRDLWVHVLSIGTETGKHPHLRSEILFLKFCCWDFDQELVLISPAVESAPTNETILSPGYETGTGVPQTHG